MWGYKMTIEKFSRDYNSAIKEALDKISVEKIKSIINIILKAYRRNKQIFIIGNGGSASTASHFACDLGKNTAVKGKPRFRVMSLNDNIALITALSNDIGYAYIFKEQMVNLINKDDVVLSITGSGNSKNLLEAARYARSKGAINVGLIGFGGGKLKNLVDESIIVASYDYGVVESVHAILEHLISNYIGRKIKE